MLGGGPPARMQPVGLLWDIENCPVPNDVRSEDVAVNIRQALRNHPIVGGPVTVFSAYGDFNQFPRKLREGCQRTGVNLIDVPNGRKDAADKAILVDLFLFAIDHPPPSTIFLISGDVDFSAALHKLSQRGYTIVLAHGAGNGHQGVSLALSNAASHVWQWKAMARGQGLIPPQFAEWGGDATRFSPPLTGTGNQMEGSPARPLPFPAPHFYPHTPSFPQGGPAQSESHPPLPQSFPPGPLRLVPTSALLRSASTAAGSPLLSNQPTDGAHVTKSELRQTPHRADNDVAGVSGTNFLGSPLGENRHQERLGDTPPVRLDGGERTGMPGVGNEVPGVSQGVPGVSNGLPGVSNGVPSVSNEMTAVRSVPESSGDGEWAKPGDIPALKVQLTELLRRNGGRMDLVRVPPEYRRVFGRPLFLSEYNALKLHHLMTRMGDPIVVSCKGLHKSIQLRNRTSRPVHVARQPSAAPMGQYWAGEASSSGEGEELEARRKERKFVESGAGTGVVECVEQLEGRPRSARRDERQTVGVAGDGNGSRWGSAQRTGNGVENGTANGTSNGMVTGTVDGTARTDGTTQLHAREDEIFASLIEMDGSEGDVDLDDVAGQRGSGWESGKQPGLGRRDSERFPVVDLLSGEAFEPVVIRTPEFWFGFKETARGAATERMSGGTVQKSAQLKEFGDGTGPAAEGRAEESVSDRSERNSKLNEKVGKGSQNEQEEREKGAEGRPEETVSGWDEGRTGKKLFIGELEEREKSAEVDEDEEQQGWRRLSALRGGGVDKNRDGNRQPGAYWERLRVGPGKEHRSERARGEKGFSDEGGSSAGEGYATPGTPEIAERR